MTPVSIVIPCFNHAHFLREAIESALAQTWPAVEIVVVDDGSTDETASVASAYPAVRLVRQQNQGLASARNVGLRVSRGEVLIFLDADDRLLPGAAEAAVRTLERHPAAMMVFGRCHLIDALGAPMRTNLPNVRAKFFEELLRRNYIWMPAMAAYRRSVFDIVGGFDPRYSPSADYDLYLRIARRFEIVPHDAVVAHYRQHGANMSRNPAMMLRTTLNVLREQRRGMRPTPSLRAAYSEGRRHWRAFYGEHLVERFRTALRTRGAKREAVRHAWELLRLYPRGVLKHLARKALVLAGYAGRAMPAADTAAPTSRASASPGSR